MNNIKSFNEFINESFDNNYLITENDDLYKSDSILDYLNKEINSYFCGKIHESIDETPVKVDLENGSVVLHTMSVNPFDNIISNNQILTIKYNDIIKKIIEYFKNNVKVASDDYIEKNYNNINNDESYSKYCFDTKNKYSLLKTLGVKSGVKLNELEMPPFSMDDVESNGYSLKLRDYKTGKTILKREITSGYSFDEIVDEIKKFYKIKINNNTMKNIQDFNQFINESENPKKYKKEILQRGYVTNALTDENDKIYGLIKDQYINFEKNTVIMKYKFYWSEVYCGNPFVILSKGKYLVNPTPEELSDYFEQSKVNLQK